MSYIFDTFTNFLSGLGVPGRDKMTAHRYTKQVWTRDQLEASYQSDWIARKAIQIPAYDATREWRKWQAEQNQIEDLEAVEDALHLKLKMQEALVKARLYGGSCILIGVDGNMASELDPESVKKDGLKFLHVLAPHHLVIQELIKDITSPWYGEPEYYTLHDDTGKFGSVNIHPSRMVRLVGLDPPDKMANYGWGDPLMQTIHDAVAAAGTVQQSIAAMISEAKFDVVKIPGLTEIFSTSDGTERLIKRFTEANVAKSVINAVVLDGEEEWQRIGVDFNGMPEVLQMYMQIASGAADIPVTRFLGMSPAGMNATGQSDLQNYYDRIHADQELRYTPALERLDIVIQCSALGSFDPNIFYEWNSLWQVDDAVKAAIAMQKANATKVDVDSGLIPHDALVKGRINQLIEDGTYPGLESAIEESIENQDLVDENELAMSMMEEKKQAKADELDLQKQKIMAGAANQNNKPGSAPSKGGQRAQDSADTFLDPRFEGLLRLHDLLVAWDPNLHPRDELGQFAVTGSTGEKVDITHLPHAAVFVSPSVKSGMDFKTAAKEIGSRQQVRLTTMAHEVHDKVGLRDVHIVPTIGAWKDGKEHYAENSVMTRSSSDWDRNVLAGVMAGHVADQKQILVFEQQADGKAAMVQFFAKTAKLDTVHKNLNKADLPNHTIVPVPGGAMVYMIDIDGSTLDRIDEAAKQYGEDNPVYYQFGKAAFIGNEDYGGSDREQRDRAREVYEEVIERSPVQNAQSIWKDVRDYWLPPYEQEGFDLTPMSIIAESPNIKKNSVLLNEAGAKMNERAGKIIKKQFGVDFIDEDNHTPEMDEYLANVIAMELREALISGASGADWYDTTMKEAMDVAEEIYPGLKNDKDKKFAYTVSLAITSQGEVVSRSAELADIAYTQFLKTGKFPEDIASKDKNIKGNFKKMNTLIEELGGVDKAREFFDKTMTVAELTKATKVKPGATSVTDTVQGSAFLGPKIGQGFYQNLNGNFEPITMDLWFMRSWGRITNTGVGGGGDIDEQIERVKRALHEGGHPTPRSNEKVIEVAGEIYAEHERAFLKHQKAQKAAGTKEKYKKTELVLASERLSMNAEGSLRQQPKNSASRRWSTEVFKRAIEIVDKKMNIKLTPAGAQATWWWPEKILWEEMGVTAKERDTDYKKSLIELRDRKKAAK